MAQQEPYLRECSVCCEYFSLGQNGDYFSFTGLVFWSDLRVTGDSQDIPDSLAKCPNCGAVFLRYELDNKEGEDLHPLFIGGETPEETFEVNEEFYMVLRSFTRPSLDDFEKFLQDGNQVEQFANGFSMFAFVEGMLHAFNDLNRSAVAIGRYSKCTTPPSALVSLVNDYFDRDGFSFFGGRVPAAATGPESQPLFDFLDPRRWYFIAAEALRIVQNFDTAEKYLSDYGFDQQEIIYKLTLPNDAREPFSLGQDPEIYFGETDPHPEFGWAIPDFYLELAGYEPALYDCIYEQTSMKWPFVSISRTGEKGFTLW